MSKRLYYKISLIEQGKTFHTIWYTNGRDGVLVQKGKILRFGSLSSFKAYTTRKGLKIEKAAVPPYNFDELGTWVKKPIKKLDCSTFLDYWNLFEDMAKSIQLPPFPEEMSKIYDKLFFGCNLPAIHEKAKKKFMPAWSNKELKDLARLFKYYLQNIQNYSNLIPK